MNSPMQDLETRISGLHESSNVILLLDPQKILSLGDRYVSAKGISWTVLRYNGNDLAFRREYTDVKSPIIVWVTPDEYKNGIDVTFIPDVIKRADNIINMSIFALLGKCSRDETWPAMISDHSETISKNFETFIGKYRELRKELDKKAPLTKDHVLALVIACQNPEIEISDLISWGNDASSAILQYLKMSWSFGIGDEKALKEIVRDHVSKDAEAWLEKDQKSLAVYFYVEDLFERYSVSNPRNQIRGLGMIPFDPEELKGADAVMAAVRSGLSKEMSQIAEENMTLKDMGKVIQCLPFTKPEKKWDALSSEKNAVFVSAMVAEILNDIIGGKIGNVPPQIISSAPLYHDERTKNGLELLYYLVSIRGVLDSNFEPEEDLTQLVDWYTKSMAHSMELFSARAYRLLKKMYDEKQIHDDLKKRVNDYLENIRKKIHEYLEKADLNLAKIIEKDMDGYRTSQKLSTHVLKSARKKLQPGGRLWVLLFDGMRFDTWNEVVKPIIQTRFEIISEGSYLCVLPSMTEIARTAVFAGATPDAWTDYNGRYTTSQSILAQRLLGLSEKEKSRLNFVTRGETDTKQRALEAKDYNILIYNLSDEWIHKSRSDISELNDEIRQKLENNILPDLSRIGEKDTVIITSDHGFIELMDGESIRMQYMPESSGMKVTYRYLWNVEHPAGLKVRYRPDEFYTAVKGRKWFDRSGGQPDRYSHGGVSLAEMVVPGIYLKKIETPVIALELDVPESVSGKEDDTLTVSVKVTNSGNARSDFKLSLTPNSGKGAKWEDHLDPGSSKEYLLAIPATLDLKTLDYELSYIDADKKQSVRKGRIRIDIEKRRDKVEIDLSALDRLEDEK